MAIKVLIINPFGIGDVLFTTPLITVLNEQYPGVEIGYLVNRRCESFMKQYPMVKHVFVYERDEFKASLDKHILAYGQQWVSLVKAIKDVNFDVAIDCSLNTLYGFVAMVAGIKERVGFDYKGRGKFLTTKLPFDGYRDQHVVDYYLDLIRAGLTQPCVAKATHQLLSGPQHSVGNYSPFIVIPDAEKQWVKEQIARYGVTAQQTLVAVVPGGGGSWGKAAGLKRWPIEKYVQLTDKIVEELNAVVILMGSQQEQDLASQIQQVNTKKVINLVGQTSIMQMAALFSSCALVVANDGGPLHVAAGVGAKTVSIFGPVDPLVYGPYASALKGVQNQMGHGKGGQVQQQHKVVRAGLPCQPCYRNFRMADCRHLSCLSQVSVDDIFVKVQQSLNER